MALIKSDFGKLPLGSKMPVFELHATTGDTLVFPDGYKAYAVVFMCNHCPFVQARFDELNLIHSTFKDKGLFMVGINSNDFKDYPEDDFANMKEYVKQGKVSYPYLHDVDQKVASLFGATCTPDPFVFDNNKKLVYHGRVDDSTGPGSAVLERSLHMAIAQLIGTGKVDMEQIPSIGCNIKWS